MNNPMLNLLRDPLITILTADQAATLSLPAVFAAAAQDRIDDFVYLRPHQRHALHATLCQIGAVAMVNASATTPPDDPEAWREILSNLTADEYPGQEPWRLVVPDHTKPAFLQPGADRPSEYNKRLDTPDALDITVGSKRHDVKDGVIRRPKPDHWLYALITCQTAAGFDGRGLYGVSRMNGGLSNRHGFSLTPSARWGQHITHDLRLLAERYQGANVTGHLLWTRKWNGTAAEAIPLESLEPQALYVEAGRRIRLAASLRKISHAVRASSQATRVAVASSNGRTADPWMLTQPDKAVTVNARGFDYRQVSRYLDPEAYELPLLASAEPANSAEAHLVARAMVRGQGKTEGYHERHILLRRHFIEMLNSQAGKAMLNNEAVARVNIVREVSLILSHTIHLYLQNGLASGHSGIDHQQIVDRSRANLQHAVDIDFWEHLQDGMESADPDAARAQWTYRSLIPQASRILDTVHRSNVGHAQSRFKAVAISRDLFATRIRFSTKLPPRREAEGVTSESNNERTKGE